MNGEQLDLVDQHAAALHHLVAVAGGEDDLPLGPGAHLQQGLLQPRQHLLDLVGPRGLFAIGRGDGAAVGTLGDEVDVHRVLERRAGARAGL